MAVKRRVAVLFGDVRPNMTSVSSRGSKRSAPSIPEFMRHSPFTLDAGGMVCRRRFTGPCELHPER